MEPASICMARQFLLLQQHETGGWGYTSRNAQDYLEPTCWAAMALSKDLGPQLTRALQRIAEEQNLDGGWSNLAGLPSDSMTSRAILALSIHSSHEERIPTGISWLQRHRSRDGCWAWLVGSTGFVEPTAYAILSLIATGSLFQAVDLSQPLSKLLCADGGWTCAMPKIMGVDQSSQISTTLLGILAIGGADPGAVDILGKALELSADWFLRGRISTPYTLALALWATTQLQEMVMPGMMEAVRSALLRVQQADGSWCGNILWTAMATFALSRVQETCADG
jgi:hypothetical protein